MFTQCRNSKAFRGALGALTIATLPFASLAQEAMFEPGWTLDTDVSALRFQSVKNTTKVESSRFVTYEGIIDNTGLATIKVALDSVDTNVDLRNVRMRFLLFETFQYPEATITMKIAPETLSDLEEVRRKIVTMPYTIDLHGVKSDREAEIAITLLSDDRVSVTSATPISLPVADFDLSGGVKKLEEAAKVSIIPSATVTFDFTFDRAGSAETFQAAAAEFAGEEVMANAALDSEDDFSQEACKGRFEIMSRTESIFFTSGSSRLDDRSAPVLDSISEIVERCPELYIQVIGHTDSDGTEANNLRLSQDRARNVANYIGRTGISAERLIPIGLGESQPAFPNDSAENKKRNRRIEFIALSR